jgi:hypothetical protein
VDNPHLFPVGLQLVGHDAGERGAHMLAHFGPDDVDGDHAGAIDAVPDGRLKQVARRDLGLASCRRPGPGKSQHDAGPHHRDQEAAARPQGHAGVPIT